MSTPLERMFALAKKENRASLIAYLPAGFPSEKGCQAALAVLARAGVDAFEIGYPYSDPVMDGPTIQQAAEISLKAGTGVREVFSTLKFANELGLPVVLMTYWNPIERYGCEQFAEELARNGGSGAITPDLTIEESDRWKVAANSAGINRIYVVAPSTSEDRLALVTAQCSGFVYAASLMGVTGARTELSPGAHELVSRIRKTTSLPVAVGLGISTRDQARTVAGFADGVIVASAFIKVLLDAKDEESGLKVLAELAKELVAGVREGR
jgi:tryptophan synthase alpha chain